MKSIVLYFYKNKPKKRNSDWDCPLFIGDCIIGYIRIEVRHGRTPEEALAMAKPHKDEIVLNSFEL